MIITVQQQNHDKSLAKRFIMLQKDVISYIMPPATSNELIAPHLGL